MALQTPNSPLLLQNISVTDRGEMSISVYTGQLSTRTVIDGIKKVKNAFPNLPSGFYDILSDRIKENGFSDERLIDAINHVIDNCIYPTPTIANFIGYDKRIRLCSYEEMLSKETGSWDNYKPVKLPDREKLVWVHTDDIKRSKLQIFEK